MLNAVTDYLENCPGLFSVLRVRVEAQPQLQLHAPYPTISLPATLAILPGRALGSIHQQLHSFSAFGGSSTNSNSNGMNGGQDTTASTFRHNVLQTLITRSVTSALRPTPVVDEEGEKSAVLRHHQHHHNKNPLGDDSDIFGPSSSSSSVKAPSFLHNNSSVASLLGQPPITSVQMQTGIRDRTHFLLMLDVSARIHQLPPGTTSQPTSSSSSLSSSSLLHNNNNNKTNPPGPSPEDHLHAHHHPDTLYSSSPIAPSGGTLVDLASAAGNPVSANAVSAKQHECAANNSNDSSRSSRSGSNQIASGGITATLSLPRVFMASFEPIAFGDRHPLRCARILIEELTQQQQQQEQHQQQQQQQTSNGPKVRLSLSSAKPTVTIAGAPGFSGLNAPFSLVLEELTSSSATSSVIEHHPRTIKLSEAPTTATTAALSLRAACTSLFLQLSSCYSNMLMQQLRAVLSSSSSTASATEAAPAGGGVAAMFIINQRPPLAPANNSACAHIRRAREDDAQMQFAQHQQQLIPGAGRTSRQQVQLQQAMRIGRPTVAGIRAQGFKLSTEREASSSSSSSSDSEETNK